MSVKPFRIEQSWPMLLSAVLFTLACAPGHATRIFAVQGAGAVSPLAGRHVRNVPGIITFVTNNGFYLEDPLGDGNQATSDAVFVYTRNRPGVHAGDHVVVSGVVREHRPGGRKTNNLSVTEIHTGRVRKAPRVFKGEHVHPVAIGRGGRLPPTRKITGPVPGDNGTAFFESLEGMRVAVEAPQVIGPVNRYGEFWVVASHGNGATGMNPSGGITLRRTPHGMDANPERICIKLPDNASHSSALNVGTRLGTIQGVVTYDYGRYEVLATGRPHIRSARKKRPEARLKAGRHALTVATYNVENLGPDKRRLEKLARQIVTALHSPDILALEEIQDDSGPSDDGEISATGNLSALETDIRAVGGPEYRSATIKPMDNRDGGEPGANIRQVILYDSRRVTLAPSRGGHGDANTPTRPGVRHGELTLTHNPGRIRPRAYAFHGSRKPLAAEFAFQGARIIVVAVHLTSKRGSTSRYGMRQPPRNAGERRREAQAGVLRRFADNVLGKKDNARLIVLGDFNDFGFSSALQRLSPPLHDLLQELHPVQRYSYVYRGNSQALDHILVSPALRRGARVEIVHVNAEYARQFSDHDPVLARFKLAGG
jgi:predicted extracellular nuclease